MADYLKLSDEELIARCLEKDAEAWEVLVRRYQRLIASVTYKFGLSRTEAPDVFQSVCMALFQQMASLREQAKLSSWLITVCVRECWKVRERKRASDSIEFSEYRESGNGHDSEPPAMEEDLLALERQHLVRRAVELLPLQCRRLIEHLFYHESPTTYAEISRSFGIPIASIGPTRGRCLAKLRTNLKKLGFR
ncbi:MAG: sigma-70 family RNA polymerase sigma factor [Acidobacteriota bacterium]